jgi:hypothetical protein
MSYSRRYHETITVNGSKTVSISYPASERGGYMNETIYYTEHVPVDVNINVDTNPFDRSVSGCNNSVNLLTGAVIATETAQLASINSNAKKIAGTIVEGFFKNIRFEISTQITELTQKIDAYLMHLYELSKQLVAKKEEMEANYNRTANRYGKIFEDLNNELSNRIFELDRPVFTFKQLADSHSQRTSDNDLVSSVAVTGAEGGCLQARISASITKKRALDAICQANIFLTKQKSVQRTINQSMLNENTDATKFSPICFLETRNENSQIGKSLYQPDYLPKMQANSVIEDFQTKQWTAVSKENQENIGRYFNTELNNAYSTADPHTNRVKDTIMKIFDLSLTKSV